MKSSYRWLYAIIAATLILKIPALFRPLTGYFASYQAINAMMTDMMLRFGWEMVAAPRTFLVSGDSPSLHLLYYPFGSLTAAGLSFLTGGALVFWGRFQALLYSTASIVLFWKIILELSEDAPDKYSKALTAVLFFSLAPMSLLMGVAFQNESAALCFLLASFCLLLKNISMWRVFLAAVLFSLAVTARIHFCLIGPAFLYLLKARKHPWRDILLFAVFSIIPVCCWYGWVWVLEHQYPNQIQTSFFSQMGEGRVLTFPLFLTGTFWFSLGKIFAGIFATPLIPLCAFFVRFKTNRIKPFWLLWLFSALAVILVLPRKVIDHPFYLLAALPPVCVFAAEGFSFLSARYGGAASRLFKGGFILAYALMIFRFYLPPAFSNQGTPDLHRIGGLVHVKTKEGDRVAAQCGASPELLFYTGRLGWPFDLEMEKHPLAGTQLRHQNLKKNGYGDLTLWLEHLRGQGASHLVISDVTAYRMKKEFKNYVESHFKSVAMNDPGVLLFDLTPERGRFPEDS